MKYANTKSKPRALRKRAVAAVAAQFVLRLTSEMEAAELEVAMLRGGQFEHLADYCDPEVILGDAFGVVFDDLYVGEEPLDLDNDPFMADLLESAEAVALLMLADVYGVVAA